MTAISLWIGVAAGLASTIQVFVVVSKRIRRAYHVHEVKVQQVADASAQLREKAQTTLRLKREQREMQAEVGQLSGDIDKGEEAVAEHKRHEDFLRVLDERKNAGDTAFIATISHKNFAELSLGAPADIVSGWQHGHRYLVWAATPKTARAKAQMRFSVEKGYAVGAVEPCAEDAEEL